MCIGKNNVYVIGKMIHKFCYSHLIMINTLYTCTVQVRVLYTVQQWFSNCGTRVICDTLTKNCDTLPLFLRDTLDAKM